MNIDEDYAAYDFIGIIYVNCMDDTIEERYILSTPGWWESIHITSSLERRKRKVTYSLEDAFSKHFPIQFFATE